MKDDDNDGDEESGNQQRYAVLPSLIALQQMRNRLHMAHDGKRLMKWSALATGREMRRVGKEIASVYETFTEDVRNAFIILARCRYFYPNVNTMVLENPAKKACVTISKNNRSVAGCKLTTFDIEDECPDSYPCLGIDRGGDVIGEAKRLWHDLLTRMIEIQELRSNFISLDMAHRNANKKSNVLGKIIIPRTDKTIRYILSELEELEREEFFRLKKVLEVKYRHKKKKKEQAPAEPQPIQVKPGRKAPSDVKQSPVTKEPSESDVFCPLCERPMPPDGKPMTAEQIKQERAAIAGLNEKLGNVLDATEAYAKTTPQKDDFQEFKQTAKDLRKKLHAISTTTIDVFDHVDITKLCDVCKDIYNESLENAKCVVCGEPVKGGKDKIPAEAKESKKKLQVQLDTILSAIKEYEKQGMPDDKIQSFKETAAELKSKLQGPPIPPDVDVNRLCPACKQRMNKRESKISIKTPSVASEAPNAPVIVPAFEGPSQVQSAPSGNDDLALGVFETEEITEIIQVRNPDGTVTEKRRMIKIVRKPASDQSRNVSRGPSSGTFKDKKNVGHVSVHTRKRLMERLPRDVQSDNSLASAPMTDRLVRACVSSSFDFRFEELLTNTDLSVKDTKHSSHVLVITGSSEFERSLSLSDSVVEPKEETSDNDNGKDDLNIPKGTS